MTPPEEKQPTEAELEILQVLWQEQPATVKTVHERLAAKRQVGYTTILKQMQRMYEEKGLLTRTQEGKVHYYSAVHARSEIQSSLLDRLVDSAFGGSTLRLALRALGRKPATPEELEELQRWLDQQKKKP